MAGGRFSYRKSRCRRNIPPWKRISLPWRNLAWMVHPLILMLLVAILVSAGLIHLLETQLRPTLETVAEAETRNAITELVERAVMEDLERRDFSYSDMVCIQRNEQGDITALTTDMAAMNLLRTQLLEQLLVELENLDAHAVRIPVGSLTDSELLWNRGPEIQVQSFTVGTVAAAFDSAFSTAGVNQTLHKIWLSVSVPITILLPGTRLETAVETQICVAETVIVGQVPNYVQKTNG